MNYISEQIDTLVDDSQNAYRKGIADGYDECKRVLKAKLNAVIEPDMTPVEQASVWINVLNDWLS